VADASNTKASFESARARELRQQLEAAEQRKSALEAKVRRMQIHDS